MANIYRTPTPSPIVRDMQRTAQELGIVTALLDALVFIRDNDTTVAAEQVREALQGLGVSQASIDAHVANCRPA